MKKKFEIVVKAKAGSGVNEIVKKIENALKEEDIQVVYEQLPRTA